MLKTSPDLCVFGFFITVLVFVTRKIYTIRISHNKKLQYLYNTTRNRPNYLNFATPHTRPTTPNFPPTIALLNLRSRPEERAEARGAKPWHPPTPCLPTLPRIPSTTSHRNLTKTHKSAPIPTLITFHKTLHQPNTRNTSATNVCLDQCLDQSKSHFRLTCAKIACEISVIWGNIGLF